MTPFASAAVSRPGLHSMLSRLVSVNPRLVRWKKDNVYGFLAIHLIAALAVVPWFFSWTGVVLLLAGLYVFGVLGINLCFHRLLTHRGLACPLWLERSFAFLGVCCVQDSPPHWVAVHRKHHHYADDEHDPHSPLVSFFWAHMGWLLVRMESMKRGPLIERYAKDIMRDPFYSWLERRHSWLMDCVFHHRICIRRILGRRSVRRYAIRLKPVRLGCSAAHGGGVAYYMVDQFRDPCLGLSELRNARREPQQRARSVAVERRRLAQQSSCRPAFGTAWSHAEGD